MLETYITNQSAVEIWKVIKRQMSDVILVTDDHPKFQVSTKVKLIEIRAKSE